MSTRYSDVRWKCYRASSPLHNTAVPEERPGASSGFQEPCVTENPSNEHVHTTTNLCIRRRILLRGQDEQIDTSEDQLDSRSQLSFTSIYLVRPERSRTQNQCTRLLSDHEQRNQSDAPRRSDLQHLEVRTKTSPPNSLKESAPKDDDGSHSRDGATKPSGQSRAGNHFLEGIQRRLGPCDQTRSAEKGTHRQFGRSDHQRPVPGSKSEEGKPEVYNTPEQKAEGRHSHADRQFSTCSPTAINQVPSSPPFPFDLGSTLETDADLISSTAAAMSTLVSVLAPHWSGKFRRHKQGLGEAEPDVRSSGQNKNLAGPTQSVRRKSFLLNHTAQPRSEWNDGFTSKTTGTPSTGRNFAEWQRDITESIQSNRPLLKASSLSLSPNGRTADLTEFGEDPKPPQSLQLNDYRRISQPDQAKFQSSRSRPTTSTLLLYSRRLNSQKANAQPVQMNKQLSASVSSLNVPSKGILKHPGPFSPLVPSNDLTKESGVLSASLEQLSFAERSTLSRDPEASRKPLYSRNSEHDVSIKASQPTTRERLYSNDGSSQSPRVTNKDMLFSNSLRFNQPEAHKYFQRHQREFLTRQDSQRAENSGPVRQTSTDKENLNSSPNFNTHSPTSTANWNSPKEIGSPRFFLTQELSNRSPVSPNYPRSDFNTSRHNSQPSATSPDSNISSVSLNQPISPRLSNTNYALNAEKTNAVYSTASYTSLSSPKPVQSLPLSPSVGLTVQSHTQSPSSADNQSPGPVSSFRTRTFTDRLSISPKKDSSVDETSPTHKWQNYLNSRRLLESTPSTAEQTALQSPGDFKLRRACSSSIYTYLRETSTPNNTDTPSPFSSPSPLTSSLKQDRTKFSREDKNTGNLRFSFDFSPAGSQDGDFKHTSPTTSGPQSLPADNGGRSMTRLSKSPYSTLISSRQRLSSSSSPSPSSPNGSYHKRSVSFDGSVCGTDSPKEENTCTPTNKYQLVYRTTEEPVGSGNIHTVTRTPGTPAFPNSSSRSLNISFEDSPDTRLPDCRTPNLLTNTTHSKHSDGYVKITPHKKLNSVFTSYRDKGNTSPTDVPNSKKVSSPPSTATITETVLEDVTQEPLQRSPSLCSRKGLLSLLNRKDNLPSADKDDPSSKKTESTGFKTTKKVDQVLHRLKVTFGVKLPEEDSPAVKKKTKNQEPSDIKPHESTKKEEDGLSESTKPFDSSESKLERQNNLLNLNVSDHRRPHQKRSSFQSGQPGSESTKKDGGRRAESPTLMSRKIPNPQIAAVKESDLSFGPVSQPQPIEQENKPFDVNLGKRPNLLKPDSPTSTHASIPPIASVKGSGNPPRPMSGFKLERQEALTNVDTHKTLDEWILCKQSSSDWTKAGSTRKEEDGQVDAPTGHSQKSSSPQPTSFNNNIRESSNPSDPKSGFKLDEEKPKGTRKEEERPVDTQTLTTQMSLSLQMKSVRESDNSPSPTSGLKPEIPKNSRNVHDLKLQSPKLAKSESSRSEEDLDLKVYVLKSPKSPIAFKGKLETPSVSVSGHSSETQGGSPKELDKRKRGLSSPLSPNFPKPDLRDRSATLPLGRKSSLSPSPTSYPFDPLLEDVQNDNVFQSPKLRKKSHAGPIDVPNPDADVRHGRTNSTGPDLMYGLQRSRSVSVSSVVSGRPSGPGRISTGSKHGSIGDLSNLDGSRSRHSSASGAIESPDCASSAKSKGSAGPSLSDGGILSPASVCSWEAERDPTPPPSPAFSRRMSEVSCSSPDGPTPRRFRATKSNLSPFCAFEDSGSDTTTDDEYYLNSGDDDNDPETEL